MAVLCAVATAGIVLQQEVRTPLHLPGHRGLLWLGLLVAVRLAAGRAGPALAVGAASAGLTAGLALSPDGPLGALPYLLGGAALDGAGLLPGVRGRAWALAILAAPIHLVALLIPVSRSLLVGVDAAALAQGLTTVALLHLAFGLGAGLLGWALAAAWRAGDGSTGRSARPG
jgi:hypothetical protein